MSLPLDAQDQTRDQRPTPLQLPTLAKGNLGHGLCPGPPLVLLQRLKLVHRSGKDPAIFITHAIFRITRDAVCQHPVDNLPFHQATLRG